MAKIYTPARVKRGANLRSVHFSLRNEGRERKPEAEFPNFSGPQASIPQNWQIGFGNYLSSCYTRTSIYAGRIDSLEIFALFKS